MSLFQPQKVSEHLASKEAEQQIIGVLLRKPKVADDIISALSADDFLYPDTKEIYEMICQQKREGKNFEIIDLSMIRESLKSTGESTIALAASMYDNCSIDSVFDVYVAALKERSLKRDMIKTLYHIKAELESPKPFVDCMGTAQSHLLSIGDDSAKQGVVQVKDLLTDFKKTLAARVNKEQGSAGLSTGLRNLDRLFSGMRGSHLTILAARPSEGKTTLAMNICEAVCESGVPALFFSIEMANSELVQRLTASLGGVPSEAMLSGDLEPYQRQLTKGLERIENLPLHVCSEEKISADRIRSIARMYKRVHDIGLIVIDYIGIVDLPGNKYSKRTEDIGKVSRAFKMMAKELNVPVLALCQLNRELDKADRDPRLSDLRDSGEIEQDADVVAFLARTPEEGISKVVVAKHRHAPIGHCFLKLNGSLSRFEDTSFTAYSTEQPRSFGEKHGLSLGRK